MILLHAASEGLFTSFLLILGALIILFISVIFIVLKIKSMVSQTTFNIITMGTLVFAFICYITNAIFSIR